jgi:tryptophan synthase beta chain
MSGRGDKDVDEVVEVAGWDVGVAKAFGAASPGVQDAGDGTSVEPGGAAGTELQP